MSAKFVKNFKIVRLTENLPVWKKGVYDAELYDDGTVVIHNPSKDHSDRKWSSHESWFGDNWAYHYEPENPVREEKDSAPVRNLEELIVHLDKKGLFNAHEEADKAVALLISEIEKQTNFAAIVVYEDFMQGTEKLVAKVLKERGFWVSRTTNGTLAVSAVDRG